MTKKITNHALTIIFIISLILFIFTLSIAIPIVFRPFYYLQIKTLNMEQETGFTYHQIKEAYDQILDYLTIGRPYGSGELKSSQDGYEHFRDCKYLFLLDFIVCFITGVITSILVILDKKNKIKLQNYLGFAPYFYSSIISIVLPSIVAGLCSIDFDKAFEIFHKIFFPGKSNWVFDEELDEIIKVMPETFFMNCAILIVSVLVLSNIILFIIAIYKKSYKCKKSSQLHN